MQHIKEWKAQTTEQFHKWLYKADVRTPEEISRYFISKLPSLLTLLEDQIGEEINVEIFTVVKKEMIARNEERQRIRNLLSDAKSSLT